MDKTVDVPIEVPVSSAIRGHVDTLETALRKRNKEIEELKQRLTQEGKSQAMKDMYNRGYRRGWKDACDRTVMTVDEASRSLANVRDKVFDARLSIESLN